MHQEQFKNLADEEIVKLIVHEGEPELFEVLYKRYFQKVVDKSYSFIKNKSMAEDFANDILSKAYEKLPGFKGNSLFSSWLYAITYNYSIDYLRVKKKLHYPNWNSENRITSYNVCYTKLLRTGQSRPTDRCSSTAQFSGR